MSEDRFESFLKRAAQGYNEPPETPRERMWARIEAVRRTGDRGRVVGRIVARPWARWGLGLAAALAIGIGIGRLSQRGGEVPPGPAVAAREAPAPSSVAYRLATAQYLTRAEALLTSFQTEPGPVEANTHFWANANDLLISTRLLLDSPAASDPKLRSLLGDLELVLAQIVQLPVAPRPGERDLVSQAIGQNDLLLKLRSAVPAGFGAGEQGVL